MVLVCTKTQYEAIYRLMCNIMLEEPSTIAGSLVKDLMRSIYLKMQNRVHFQYSSPKKSWNLKLTHTQAKVYYTFFDGKDLTANWEFEHYTIQLHLIEIQKYLATNF